MIYKNRFLLQRKFLRSLKNKNSESLHLTFACIDLDNVGKIHGIWGRGAASYVIKLYEDALLNLVKEHDYSLFIYARGDEFEILTTKYTAQELKEILDVFRKTIHKKHKNSHFVLASKKPTPHEYRGSYLKFVPAKKQTAILDSYNEGVLFFPDFSCGIAEGNFSKDENIVAETDALRFFGTLALTDAKLTKGSTVLYPKRIEEESSFGKEYGFSNIENKVKKFKKKLKRNINIDDHHINLGSFDHVMAKNPYAKYKKYLLIEFLWYGSALDDLLAKGIELRGGIDGYGLKGMIQLLDPNTLYYMIAQNMDSAVNVLNHHKINERKSKLTRFLDRMEVYFNNRLTEEELLTISDEISFSINQRLKGIHDGVSVRVFLTLRSASKARKSASFRSYIEFVSKITPEEKEGWKHYSEQGNILAVFNTTLLSKIVAYQSGRAAISSEKLLLHQFAG